MGKNKTIQKVCEICGKSYYPDKKTGIKFEQSKYCSLICLTDAKKRGSFIPCDNCGKKVWKQKRDSDKNIMNFCCKECYGIAKSKLVCGENNIMYGKNHRVTSRRNMSLTQSERKDRSISSSRKRADLDNEYFRSSWEANYARYLNELKIEWQYEPKTFVFHGVTRGALSYTPDFKLLQTDEWVEVKGWFRSADKTKIKRFKKFYPDEFKKLTFLSIEGNKKFCEKHGIPLIDYKKLEKENCHLKCWEQSISDTKEYAQEKRVEKRVLKIEGLVEDAIKVIEHEGGTGTVIYSDDFQMVAFFNTFCIMIKIIDGISRKRLSKEAELHKLSEVIVPKYCRKELWIWWSPVNSCDRKDSKKGWEKIAISCPEIPKLMPDQIVGAENHNEKITERQEE